MSRIFLLLCVVAIALTGCNEQKKIDALTQENAESSDLIVCTPNLASVFDEQYRKGMGFKNEKHWKEKHDGKTVFWG